MPSATPTTITAKASPATVANNKPFWVNGTLNTTDGIPLAGATIQLQKNVSGTTKTTTTGGVIPSVSQTMTTHATYSYRWHFTGTGTYQAGYSPVKTFTV